MRGKKKIAFILGLISTLASLGCASTPDSETKSPGARAARECFDQAGVRAYSPLDERFVYVRVRGDKHYLLTIDRADPSFLFANGITISNTVRNVCSHSGAVLTYSSSGRRVSFRILRVESVAGKEEALKLVRDRT